MVKTPESARSEVQVAISGDSTSLNNAADGAISSLSSLKGATTAAGAALGAFGAAMTGSAINSARAFEEQMVEVRKVTSDAIADELSEDIQEMSEEIPQSQKALSNIAETAGRLGVEGSENISTFTRVVAEISTSTDLAAENAADSFARIATLTEEPIENIRDLGNVVNRLSNSMAASASEISDSMTRASGTLTQFGLSTTEIAGLTASMNEVSASSRRAGTQLRRLGQELQTVDSGAVTDALGLTVEQFEELRDENPNELIVQLAETMKDGGEAADILRNELSTTSRQAISGLGQNLESVREAQQAANEEMKNGSSLTEEFEAANSTFNASLQRLENQVRNVGITVGERLLPPLSEGIEIVTDGVTAFQTLNKQTDGLAGTVSTVGLAVGGFSASIAAMASQLGIAGSAAGTLGAGLAALTGPVGIAIAAIGALAAASVVGFDAIANKAEGLTDTLIGEGGKGGALGEMVDRGVAFLKERAPELVGDAMEFIGRGIRLGVMDITNPLRGEDSVFWGMLSDAGTWLIDNGPKLFFGVGEAIVDSIIAGAKGLYRGLVGNSVLKDQISDAGDWLVSNADDLVGGVGSALVGTITDGAKAAGGAVKRGASAVTDAVGSAGESALSAGRSAIDRGAAVAGLSPSMIRDALDGLTLELSGELDVSGDVATMTDVDARLRRAGREADDRGIN